VRAPPRPQVGQRVVPEGKSRPAVVRIRDRGEGHVAPGDSRDRLRVTLFAFCLHFFSLSRMIKETQVFMVFSSLFLLCIQIKETQYADSIFYKYQFNNWRNMIQHFLPTISTFLNVKVIFF
jgi:hypothetical protein